MNPAFKRIFCSAITVLFLLSACAPAPSTTQDPALEELSQKIDSLVATQNALPTRDPALDELSHKIDALVATQNAQSGQNPALDELKQQVEAIAANQQALSDALLNPQAVPVEPTVAADNPAPTLSPATAADAVTPPVESESTGTPEIESVYPAYGETYGGKRVTITGKNLRIDNGTERINAEFYFGALQATDVECISAEECTAKTPNGNVGIVPVVANINGATSSSQVTFEYLDPPTIENVSPNSGPAAGGTVISITGQNFIVDDTTFYFDQKEAKILDCAGKVCRVVSPGINTDDPNVVVWVQAVNSNGAASQRDTSPDTRQAFKYAGTPKYACNPMLLLPETKGPYKPGQSFRIKWVVKNIGTAPWPAGQDVHYSSGTNMGEVSSQEIGKVVKPNDTATITLDAKAPKQAGLYYMNWVVAGQGCSLYVAIKVE